MSWSSDSSRIPPEVRLRDRLNWSKDANGARPSTMLDALDAMTQPEGAEIFRKLRDVRDRPFEKFEDFVTAPEPHGMGMASRDDLIKHLDLRHKEEVEPYRRAETVERLTEMRRRVRTLLKLDIPEAPRRTRGGLPSEIRGTNYRKQPQTDTVEHVVGRLKRDDPELAQQVISGQKSPDAAAREKGWRKPRITLSSPERVAKRLRGHFKDPEQRRLLADLLTKED